jgi:hypothetical protein
MASSVMHRVYVRSPGGIIGVQVYFITYYATKQDWQYTYNVTLFCVRATTVAVEKQLSITYSECVFVALRMQHVILMHHIVICGLFGSTNFPTLSHKRHYFRKKSY